MRTRSILVTIALVLAASVPVISAIQPTISVQGRLTDSAGVPLPVGTKKAIFKIFNLPVGGSEIWPMAGLEEAHNIETDAAGVWGVELGTSFPITDAVFSAPERWLEVTVDDGVNPQQTFPRLRMTSNPWSFRTSTIDGASGGDIFGDIWLHSDLIVGESGDAGHIEVRDAIGIGTVEITGSNGNIQADGEIQKVSALGGQVLAKLGINGAHGVLRTYDSDGDQTSVIGTASNNGGFANFHMINSIWPGVTIDGDDGNSGLILLKSGVNSTRITLDANNNGGATLEMRDGTNRTIWFNADAGGGGGGFLMYNSLGNNTIELDADEANDVGVFRLFNATSNTRVRLHAEGAFAGGEMLLLDGDGNITVDIQAAESLTNGAQIQLRKSDGTTTITLDAEHGEGGTGRIITPVLQITGGADLSEQFEIHPQADGVVPEKGMVVCLDAYHPGDLLVSSTSYDRTVAGIVSGAGGINTGMLMGQIDSEADGQFPVALTGRVYVMADAHSGPIAVGDLLTTSDTPGHAMRVADYERAQGAIIGKAMSTLNEGRGLVLVLVSLQ